MNTVAPYETTKKFDGFLAGGITTVTIPETYYAIVQTDSLGLFKVQTEWLMVIGDQLSAKVHMNKWRAIHSDESRANHWNTDG